MNNRGLLLLLMAFLAGCATSGYKQFFEFAPGIDAAEIERVRAGPAPASPTVYRVSGDPAEVVGAMARRGYMIVGHSAFNSGMAESGAGAVEQGRQIGADEVVVLNPRYTGTVSTTIPITTPKSETTYSYGSATAYGPGGTVTAYGSGTSTTYRAETTYVPMTYHRYDYLAMYFVKMRVRFGAFYVEPTDADRQKVGSNRGVVITTVVDGSPAYIEDVLPGDIVLDVNGAPVHGVDGFNRYLARWAGQSVTLTIFRNGSLLQKTVRLNP